MEKSTLANRKNTNTHTEVLINEQTDGWEELTTVQIPDRVYQPATSNLFKLVKVNVKMMN